MIVEKEKIRFIVDIVDHCNLNCKCCGHFSPLAPKGFLDINTFERDLKRLHELLYGHIHCFELMGGESLLHPRLYRQNVGHPQKHPLPRRNQAITH